MLQFTYYLPDINLAAEWLWQCAHSRRIWLWDAPMGAGKTTLTAAITRYLNSEAEASSPTYGLVQEYPVPEQNGISLIAHMDWYRLRDEQEATDAGMEEYLTRANCLCIIEWPERAEGLLRGLNAWRVQIKVSRDGERTIKLSESELT